MKKYCIAILIVLTQLTAHTALAEQATKESVLELMEITGAAKIGKMFTDQLKPMFRQAAKNVPDAEFDALFSEMNPEEILELTIPVYQKHFTESDVQALLKFYRTPVGQKFVRLTPTVTKEAMAIGEKWGRQKAVEVLKKLKAKNKAAE